MHFSSVSVDVILPFYNRVSETCRAVNSVLSQTHSAFRLILVNDGSCDDISCLLEIIDSDTRCILIHHENNLGPSSARNTGLKSVKSEYIAFLDSDDYWHPAKLQTQLTYMMANNSLMTYTSYYRLCLASSSLKRVHMPKSYKLPFMAFTCKIATPTVMISSKLINYLSFPPSCRLGEDIIAWSNLSRYTDLLHAPYSTTFVCVGPLSSSQNFSKQLSSFRIINRAIFRSNLFFRSLHFVYYHIASLVKGHLLR